jgi:hypothetical protein
MNEKTKVLLVALTGVAVRIVVLVLSTPSPYKPVDVYFSDTEAAKTLTGLQNPYTHIYSADAGNPKVFAYLPVIPIYFVPFVLLGDVRYGGIFADLVIILSCFSIGRLVSPFYAICGSLAYALFPVSIWLTSVSATNVMVGAMFLLLAFVAMFTERYSLSSLFLGIGLATNQLIILTIPFFAFYLFKTGKLSYLSISVAVGLAITLPFFLASPANFLYDVVFFQFSRPLQTNGAMSLLALIYDTTGFTLILPVRAVIVVFCAFIMLKRVRGTSSLLLGSVMLLVVGASVLPVNTFWNYFLLPSALFSPLVPAVIMKFKGHSATGKRKLLQSMNLFPKKGEDSVYGLLSVSTHRHQMRGKAIFWYSGDRTFRAKERRTCFSLKHATTERLRWINRYANR